MALSHQCSNSQREGRIFLPATAPPSQSYMVFLISLVVLRSLTYTHTNTHTHTYTYTESSATTVSRRLGATSDSFDLLDISCCTGQ